MPNTACLDTEHLMTLMSRMTGDEKHSSSATSTLDILSVLYGRVLNIQATHLRSPKRDRFVLSKGHGPMAYYAVLAASGFFPEAWLDQWATFNCPLGMHPDSTLIPGVEIGAGSLGHGLPIASGMAYALAHQGNPARVFVLVGDAELDEGSNHEAIAVAGRLQLTQLTAIVVDNRSASHGWPGGIATRFESEGWVSRTVDGHHHPSLEGALTASHPTTPLVVVAQTRREDQ